MTLLGMAKQALVFESLWGEMGGRKQGAEEIADRLLLGAGELLFPLPDAQGRGLRHFPRRYVKAGELTRVDDLHEGEMLTVVGEIARSDLRQYRDRRSGRQAYRLETVLQTDKGTFENKVILLDRARNMLMAPGKYRIYGSGTPAITSTSRP